MDLLDLADAEYDRSHMSELSRKLRNLIVKLKDIQQEQQYQRECEAAFRETSETTNSKAVLPPAVDFKNNKDDIRLAAWTISAKDRKPKYSYERTVQHTEAA